MENRYVALFTMALCGGVALGGCQEEAGNDNGNGGTGGGGGNPGAGGSLGTGGNVGTGGNLGADSNVGAGGNVGTGNVGTGGTGGTGGTTQMADNTACGNVGVAGDGSTCMSGLNCTDPTGVGNKTCTCPSTGTPPKCTMDGNECAAFSGTNCLDFGGQLMCLSNCTAPGEMAPGCPDPLVCTDPLGNSPFCAEVGAFVPPACTMGGTECAQYPATVCLAHPVAGMACLMSCTI